ncbi:hypothetical protein GCM10027052_14160 [Parafrigoribacterium mesophilum]|uniref:hypothetical protein n=1 Tax=Parafrigoribacterium mesophilum TaxID=433646 RepID=UPI0031FE21E8
MKFVSKLGGAAVVAAVVMGMVGLGATSAQAATEDDVASWITSTALDRLGVEVQDASLADALNSAIHDAVAAGLISVEVQDTAQSDIDDPDAVTDDEADGVLDDELEDQTGQWQDIAAEWHAAFDEIKADFVQCREAATGGANDCAHQFRYDMQVNHVKAWQARQAAKLGDISALPQEEQDSALQKLQEQGARAEARLAKAADLLERQTGDDGQTSDQSQSGDEADSGDSQTDSTESADGTKQKSNERGHGNKHNAKADNARANRGGGQGNSGR